LAEIKLRWVEGKMMVGSDSSVASCSAYDVVDILTKQRQPLVGLKLICTGEQQNEPPYFFTNIHVRYEAQGAVDPDKLEKAIQLSEDKYCSVINTLKKGVPFSREFVVNE